ncbi:MAG TPA: hypothetical protein VK826_12685 [Bacteroidia bacterium]|nr:hypothetical protein [Bacteroidia bacterium]
MKNALRISIAVTVISFSLSAQNLVPNPGFESLKQTPCDHVGDKIADYIGSWQQGSTGEAGIACDNNGKCETSCAKGNTTGYGEEVPHGGHNVGWVCCCKSPGSRSYLGVTLAMPLTVGREYYFEMFVSVPEHTTYYTGNIGVCLRTGAFAQAIEAPIYGTPQVNNEELISVTNGWAKVSGKFVADKAYTWMLLGNFKANTETVMKSVDSPVPGGSKCHCCFYLDDVLLRAVSNLSVSGDSVVNIGATATLTAKGGTTYSWADIRSPKVVLGTGAELKIPVNRRTTFRVTSDDDFMDVTVEVRKKTLVYQDALNGRKVRKGRIVNVHNEEITVQVHDKNEVDGDSISLYYGDSLVAEHVALTKKKQSFTIKVNKDCPKQLVLYAENLGSVPPNTAEITIKDGKQSTSIVLGSDFKWSDSIMLVYKEED